jgi:hypothetical protein
MTNSATPAASLRADRVSECVWRQARQLAALALRWILHRVEQLRNCPMCESVRVAHGVAPPVAIPATDSAVSMALPNFSRAHGVGW